MPFHPVSTVPLYPKTWIASPTCPVLEIALKDLSSQSSLTHVASLSICLGPALSSAPAPAGYRMPLQGNIQNHTD